MKKVLLWAIICFAGVSTTFAEGENELGDSPRWYVSPGVGMMFFEGNQAVDEGLNMLLRLGYDFSYHWSWEIGASWAPNITSNGRDGKDDAGRGGHSYTQSGQDVVGLFSDILYHFDRYNRFDPYLSAGFGCYRANKDIFCEADEFAVCGPQVGVGMMYNLTDRWALRADFRTFMAIDDTCEVSYTLDAGIAYRFGGGAESAPEPETDGEAALAGLEKEVDSDNDGLTDAEESKLGTNPRMADTDGDGLKDGDEVKVYKTDPLNADSDFDGLKDGEEINKYKTNPLDRDTDKGGVSDGHEVAVDKTNPLDPIDDLMLFELFMQFDYDKALINPKYFKELDQVARALLSNPKATAVIEGHADRRTRSIQSYNQNLSECRAKAVMNYLTKKGVSAKKMTAVGYGFSRPKVQPDLVNGNPENRRVEVYIRGAGTNADKGKYTK